jgi:carbon starvation protein
VSSGTTSKQVKNLKDTRLIGYGAMLGEGSLALATTIAAACGIGLYIGINPEYHSHDLSTFSSAANLKLDTFPNSVAALLYHSIIDLFGIKNSSIELFNGLRTFVIIVMISFAATTLDSATRICRFMIKELGQATKINFLKNKYAGTLFSIFPALMLLIIEVDGVSLGKFLWPLFGASNQMLAALTLMILVFYFNAKGIKNFLILGPMIFISFICISSFVINFKNHTINHHLVLIIINSILLTLIVWLIAEAIYHYKKTTVKK